MTIIYILNWFDKSKDKMLFNTTEKKISLYFNTYTTTQQLTIVTKNLYDRMALLFGVYMALI